jgi:hypothetical protein
MRTALRAAPFNRTRNCIMKMIALGTVHGRKLIKESDPKDPKSKAKYEDLIAAPGETFDTEDFGIGDAERKAMIASGAAKRKTREVADDGAPEPRSHGRAAGGPKQIVEDPFDKLTDAELLAQVADHGLTLPEAATRMQMIAALKAAA